MLKRIFDTAKKTQPISYTGIFTHSYYWLTSPSGDIVYQNSIPGYRNNMDQEAAIYFVHGTFDQPAAFVKIARRLINAGLPVEISSLNLVGFEQRYTGQSIKKFAEQLGNKIVNNEHKRVILIAHSRGGLVAAHFAEFLAEKLGIEVLFIVPVSAPFSGSYLAMKPLSLFSDSVREMESGSEFLQDLKKKIIENPSTSYYPVVAAEDGIVTGDSGYLPEYVEKHPNCLLVLDRHAHLSIMSSRRLVARIHELIQQLFTLSPKNIEPVIISKFADLNIIEDYLPKRG